MLQYYLNGLKKIFSIAKKVFLVIAVFVVVITLFSHFIARDKKSLQTQSVNPIEKNRAEIYKVINDKELNKTKEGKLTIALYKMSMCSMIGEACTNNPKDGDVNFQKSVFGFISKLIVLPYVNPPASGIYWAYSGLQNARFVPKTMAAEGIGFAAIKPFANLWKIFRDISYMLLVLVLIGIGFMVMFRMKMNPQTVISVENALPRIIIAFILITFSFAIAGFLIDLMYIFIVLMISILSNNNNFYNSSQFQNEFVMRSSLDIFTDIVGRTKGASVLYNIGNAILGILPFWTAWILRAVVGVVTVLLFNGVVHGALISPFSKFLNDITAAGFTLGDLPEALIAPSLMSIAILLLFSIGAVALFEIVIFLLVLGTVIFLAFRIITLLFTSYLKLILSVILSPLLLLFEAVPGKNIFSYWMKNLVGNLICFPITIFVFILGFIIINTSLANTWTIRLPYLYGIQDESFRIIMGLGLIFLIPDLVKFAKETLGIKDLPLNIGVGTFFGGAGALVGGAGGLIGQIGSWSLGISALTGKSIHDLLGGAKKPLPGGANIPEQASIDEAIKKYLSSLTK